MRPLQPHENLPVRPPLANATRSTPAGNLPPRSACLSEWGASRAPALTDPLCLACGLCCSGVLFKDVELQPGDDAARLESLGIKLQRLKTKTRFPQPCSALGSGCRCAIYPERPQRCHDFDCALLQAAQAGKVAIPTALRTIRTTRARVEKVRKLLQALGDTDEHMPLSRRFRRTVRRMETENRERAQASVFSELTMAYHELNLRLSRSFYPGPVS